MFNTFVSQVLQNCRIHPEKPALSFVERPTLSYGLLERHIAGVYRLLQSHGVGKGTPVVLAASRGPGFIFALYRASGSWRFGFTGGSADTGCASRIYPRDFRSASDVLAGLCTIQKMRPCWMKSPRMRPFQTLFRLLKNRLTSCLRQERRELLRECCLRTATLHAPLRTSIHMWATGRMTWSCAPCLSAIPLVWRACAAFCPWVVIWSLWTALLRPSVFFP